MIQKLKEQNVLASKEITFGDSDDIKMYPWHKKHIYHKRTNKQRTQAFYWYKQSHCVMAVIKNYKMAEKEDIFNIWDIKHFLWKNIYYYSGSGKWYTKNRIKKYLDGFQVQLKKLGPPKTLNTPHPPTNHQHLDYFIIIILFWTASNLSTLLWKTKTDKNPKHSETTLSGRRSPKSCHLQ